MFLDRPTFWRLRQLISSRFVASRLALSRFIFSGAVVGGLAATASPALALQIVGSMQVTGTVAAACSVSTTPMAFGTLSASTTTDSTATISVTCTSSTLYDIGIGIGDHWDNQVAARRMKHTATNELIQYLLSPSVTMTPLIGASAPNNFVDDALGTGAAQDYTVYGRANPGSIPGNYLDTLVILLTY